MKITGAMLKAFSMVSQLGLLMAVPIIFSIWFGRFLDTSFHTGYIFLIIFTLIGVCASFRNLYVYVWKAFENKFK